MFRDAFTKLDVLEGESLLAEINPLIEGSPYLPEKTTILSMELSFYPGYRFIELADHSFMPPRKTSLVYKPGKSVTILDWSNGPIYELNERVPLSINEKNITEYIRFFFTFVRGRHGRFLITESVDDIAWKDEPPATARKTISSLIEPIRLRGIEGNGSYILSARMIFKDSLFRTCITVTKKGNVKMDEEELVVEDIPVLDDVLG